MGRAETHFESDIDLTDVAAGNTVLDDMHLDASVEQIKRGLKHTDMRLDTKDDDVLNVTCVLEPLVGDAGKVHTELGLGMICRGRDLGKLFEDIAQRCDSGAESCIARIITAGFSSCSACMMVGSDREVNIPFGFCSVVKTGTSRIFAALSMRAEVFVMRSKLEMTVLNLSCMSQRKKAVLLSSIRADLNAAPAILLCCMKGLMNTK